MLQVNIDWIGAKQFSAVNVEGAKFTMDIKKKSGGSGDYASPTDHLLAAVGGCTAVDVVNILAKMRQELRSLRIEVEGIQAEEHPRYFTDIKLKYILTGDNLDRNKVEQAVELSQTSYCSVRASLSEKCRVRYEIEINQ